MKRYAQFGKQFKADVIGLLLVFLFCCPFVEAQQYTTVPINISSATTTRIITGSGAMSIYILSMGITATGQATTAGSIQFIAGSGATCGTGTTNLTGSLVLTWAGTGLANTITFGTTNITGAGTGTTANQPTNICAVTTNGASVQGFATYYLSN